jgi:hypothetical protein
MAVQVGGRGLPAAGGSDAGSFIRCALSCMANRYHRAVQSHLADEQHAKPDKNKKHVTKQALLNNMDRCTKNFFVWQNPETGTFLM